MIKFNDFIKKELKIQNYNSTILKKFLTNKHKQKLVDK